MTRLDEKGEGDRIFCLQKKGNDSTAVSIRRKRKGEKGSSIIPGGLKKKIVTFKITRRFACLLEEKLDSCQTFRKAKGVIHAL